MSPSPWLDVDPTGFSKATPRMRDLEIWVNQKHDFQLYGGRRAYEATFCTEFVKNWKRVTRGQKTACISGGYDGFNGPDQRDPHAPYKLWTWDKIKTKKGCYSYFGGASSDCEFSHWRKQGYPGPKRY